MTALNFIGPDTSLLRQQMSPLSPKMSGVAGKLDEAKKAGDMKRIEEASTEFEGVFIAEMMKPMFDGLNTEAPFGGGKSEEVFRSMMVQEYGRIIARTGSIGLSDDIKTEMIKMQEQADNAK
ncbi:MAG: rod-binding protein [Alphaproteobacteria bacterium]